MGTKFSFFSAGCLLLSSLSFAGTSTSMKCTSYQSTHLGKKVQYCLHRSHPEKAPTRDEGVVYFFHGLNGSATNWNYARYDEVVDELVKKGNFPSISFVAFDTEGTSFFSDVAGKPTGSRSYESWLVKEFMPYIENKLGVCNQRACRGTLGVSMGGAGALKTAFKHPDLFAVTAGNMPAVTPFSIHEGDAKWREYFGRHPVGPMVGFFLLNNLRRNFPTDIIFADNDPAAIVAKHPVADAFPETYFDVGDKDEYGFQEGVEILKTALDKKGLTYTSYLGKGKGHDLQVTTRWQTVEFIAEYFRKLPPSCLTEE